MSSFCFFFFSKISKMISGLRGQARVDMRDAFSHGERILIFVLSLAVNHFVCICKQSHLVTFRPLIGFLPCQFFVHGLIICV